jgi:catechol 2,3-dioxygenase-like lactoylglutathione lyase family enzyme
MKESMSGVHTLKAHIALNVADIARSVEFYRSMFGIEPSKTRSDYAKFDVVNPPLNLTLNHHPFEHHGALSHLGIQVASTEDVMTIRQHWKEAGLTTRDEMKVSCCYAVQDKAWVRDPDGNEWEVFTVLEDNLPEGTSGGTCCAVPGAAIEIAVAPVESEPCCEDPAICC